MINSEQMQVVLVALAGFILGVVLTLSIYGVTHKNHHEIIKTSIGEIILRDGKVYTVYEMQRTPNGDMVAR